MIQRAVLLNAAGFQVVWWAMALGLPRALSVWVAVVALLFMAHHLWQSTHWRHELGVIAASAALGVVVDTSLMQWGQVRVQPVNPEPLAQIQPWWLLLLWMCLGCTLRSSMQWICNWPRVGAVLCAIAGVLSYEAAKGFGLMSWTGVLPDVILAGVWGVCFPVLVLWSNGRLKQRAITQEPSAQPDLNGQSDTAPH